MRKSLEAARGRVPDGEARVSFDAGECVIVDDLYRMIRTTERRAYGASTPEIRSLARLLTPPASSKIH